MLELKKKDHPIFNEFYEGVAVSGFKVECILDDHCVRYMTFNRGGNPISRHEYKNSNKDLCYRRATEALNRL